MTKKIELNGLWHNQYGSEIKLEIDSTGRVLGKFRTAVGRAETRKDWQDDWFDLVGFLNGDLVSFIVNFSKTGAIFTLLGRVSPSGDRIEALSYTGFNGPEQDHWKSITTSANTFEKGPAPKKSQI